MASLLFFAVTRSAEMKYRLPCGNTIVCSHWTRLLARGGERVDVLLFDRDEILAANIVGLSSFACVQICGPSILRFARLPW
jgi:hypothetical protein